MTDEKAPHSLNTQQVFSAFATACDGLSESEAASRLEKYGANEIKEGGKKTLASIIFAQFKNLMILVLLAAAVVSAFLGEVPDAVIIFAVIILNAVMGTVQEARAEAALDALKKMAAPSAKVMRGGAAVTVKASELVPGDIVLLEAGDHVPADIRLIETASLKIDEAPLTGESVPVEKDAGAPLSHDTALADRVNMAFSGTGVTHGRGKGVVCFTGMDTEIGKIASALGRAAENETPLQRRLNSLSKVLSFAVLAVAAVVFAVGVATGRLAFDMFLVAVSLAVAAIPEGLATVVTLQLTMGVQKMSKNGAIVRSLPAVETLGSTNVICSDKTGTLTQNRMTVQKVFYNNTERDAGALDGAEELRLLDNAFILCNDTKESADGYIGDPTETALFAFSAGRIRPEGLIETMPRLYELPFDSERKLMSTVNGGETPILFVKGAPDELLARCTHVALNGGVETLTREMKDRIHAVNERFAQDALRVLGAAYKPLKEVPQTAEGLESGLVFIGLAGMIDPPRDEAEKAVAVCRQAGIKPVMITGDHKITAAAIAKRLGILGGGDKAVSGRELDAMDDKALEREIDSIRVYARVAPEHKVRIVKAFQSRGNVVAMTGDGVNDAPALKTADIGVGMGITGTEVSKSASDMVLTDDNFATIVKAVEEGRRIYRNIKKAVQFLLSANLSEVVTLFAGTMLGITVLSPVQILWVNLVTDTFPALAVGMESAPKDIMRRKPRDAKQSFFSEGMTFNLVFFGVVMSALTLIAYYLGAVAGGSPLAGETMAFLTLGLVQLFHVFNIRSSAKSVLHRFFENKWMHLSFVFSALLQTAVVWVKPLNAFFGVAPLNGEQWLYTLLLSFSVIPISEIVKGVKAIFRKGTRHD